MLRSLKLILEIWRKNFFKSSMGLITTGIFAKPVIESMQIEKTDAEKMFEGAKGIDKHFDHELVNWRETSMEELLKKTIISDESGNLFLNVKVE